MIGHPTAWRSSEPAPTANRAQPAVLVRMHDGELAGRVCIELAEALIASGAATAIGKNRLRYLRLEPGIVIPITSHGWTLIEEERRKHGDKAVRRGAKAFDRRPVKWQSPMPKLP